MNEKTSHTKISELSIAYLLQFDDDSVPLRKALVDSMPLAQYAAEHWIGHANSGRMDPAVLQLILHLFTSESAPFKNWIRIHDIGISFLDRIILNGFMNLSKVNFCSPLYYSSLAGMHKVLDCLLQNGENANAEGGRLGNALQAASSEGNEAFVKLLLENGAEVNAKGGKYGNALQAACATYAGNEAIVKLLLENGADVNAERGEYGNALQAASYGGNVAIMKLLLENGAEVNAEGGEYGNALQAASYRGNEIGRAHV